MLPAGLETFVQAIELFAKQRQPYKVRLIGVGEGGDTSFGEHTLASFPTHDPRKGKRIAWAWLKKEKRARRVAIAEIRFEDAIAYALEIERTNQQHAILVMTPATAKKSSPANGRPFFWFALRDEDGRWKMSCQDIDARPQPTGNWLALRFWNRESGGR